MKNSDKTEFAKVVLGFAELKGKSLSKPAVELYWAAMQAWSIEDFKAAAALLVKTCQFMPTPKEFEDLRKAGRPTSGEAWAKVLRQVRLGRVRWDGGPATLYKNFEAPTEPLINAAVDAIGGYKAIAMHDEANLHFLERRFAQHYDAIQDRQEVRESLPSIAQTPEWLKLKMDETQKRLTWHEMD